MQGALHLSVSLDGKLLGSSGKPLRRPISPDLLNKARELVLIVHPTIVGDDSIPSLSGFSVAFFPEDLEWKLLSAVKVTRGRITARYRKK